MSGSAPLLQAARLWERTSAKGTRYMTGRLGGVKVLVMPNKDFDADDPARSHTHILYFTDGTPTSPRPSEHAPTEPRERSRKAATPGNRQQIEDDVVPF
jgi:hypothetical protein